MKTHSILIASLAIFFILPVSEVFGLNTTQTMVLNDFNYSLWGSRNFKPYSDITMEIIESHIFVFFTDRNGDGNTEAVLRLGWFEADTPNIQTTDWNFRNPPTRLFSPQMILTPDNRVHLAFSQYYPAVESSEVIYQSIHVSGNPYNTRRVSGMLTHTLDLSFAMTFQYCPTNLQAGRYAPIMVYDAHGLYNHYDHNIYYQREIQACKDSDIFFWLNAHEIGKYHVSECMPSSVDWCPAADYDNTENKCHIVWDSRNAIGFNDNPCKFPPESCILYTSVGQYGDKAPDQMVFDAQLHEPNTPYPGTYYHNPSITTCGPQKILCFAVQFNYLDSPLPVRADSKRIQTNRIAYKKTDKTEPNWSGWPGMILDETQSTSDNLIRSYKFIWEDDDQTNGYLIFSNSVAHDLWLVKYVNGAFEPTKTRINTDLNLNPWIHYALDARYDSNDDTIKMCVVSGWDEVVTPDKIVKMQARIDYLVLSDL